MRNLRCAISTGIASHHSAEELERDYRYYDESGRRYRTSRAGGKVYRYYADEGKMANDWWVLPTLNSTDAERAGYPTQKPIALYKRIIEASSNEGDLVLDPFLRLRHDTPRRRGTQPSVARN